MMLKCLVIFLLFYVEINALKCYQNTSKISEVLKSNSFECNNIGKIKATGCLTYTNYRTESVTRMCDYTNCTENGIDHSKECKNDSVSQTVTCCCLSDSCNGVTTIPSPPTQQSTTTKQMTSNISLTLQPPRNANGIKCYQNTSKISEVLQSNSFECSNIGKIKATGCLTYTNYRTESVIRMCDYTNCTENGIDRAKECNNDTVAQTMTCCCLSDSCNGVTTLSSLPTQQTTTTMQATNNISLTTTSPPKNLTNTTESPPLPSTLFNNLTIAQNNTVSPALSNNNFYCYHGEGYIEKYNLSMKPILCPSKKCIIFTTYCDDYWATTCYNDHMRMAIFNKFKTAKTFLKTRYINTAFCNTSNCNRINLMGSYYNNIQPNPIPYYPLSLKNQKHERPRKILENSVTFQTAENENISFIGIPDAKADKVWMEFRIFCWPHYVNVFTKAAYKLRYTFDIKKSMVNESGFYSDKIFEDLTMKNRTSFIFNINSSNVAYNYFVNGNDRNIYYGDNNIRCTKMLIYGGKWKSIKAGISNTTHYKPLTFGPSFEPDPSKYISCFDEDVKAMIPDPNIKYASTKDAIIKDGNLKMIKVELINPLQPYGLADIEFRNNLCEFSDLIKVQIRFLSVGSDSGFQYYTNIWKRKNYLWSKFDDDEARIGMSCKKYYVGVSESDSVMFFCDNSTVFSLPIKGSFEMAQFFAQSIKKQFACF